ncbi:MAG: pseudaminic acid synthase [Candidatus Omnitrophica bacterium]|nr:pseudaminic acid synthase [Candidatus Omnitrophota bacterium]
MIRIKNREIGKGRPVYIIAEVSANHGGSLDKALALVRAAKDAGADAVKLQTYTPDTMTLDCDNEFFHLDHPLWHDQTLYQLYKDAQTPWEWHRPLKEEADRIGLDFFSTPFDETAVDFLESLDVPAYKIASFELTDDPLLKRVGQTHKPVILSTGMAAPEEIARAISVLKAAGTVEIALLKCVSAYPAPVDEMNLRGIATLQELFSVPVGLSDHSLGEYVPVVSVGVGACILEKHFWLDEGTATPDSTFSLSLPQFKQMVRRVREAEAVLGGADIGRTEKEKDSLRFRRSLFVTRDMAAGEIFTRENIQVIRPGFGLPPSQWARVIGKRSGKVLLRGQPLKNGDIEGFVDGSQPQFSFRPASLADAKLLFDWRNDDAVKKTALIQKEILWKDHVAWLAARIDDVNSIFEVVEFEKKPVAQVRFDIQGQEATVSLTIDASFRGRGLGPAILKTVCPALMVQRGWRVVKAKIVEDNDRSLSCFLKAGFVFNRVENINGVAYFLCELYGS